MVVYKKGAWVLHTLRGMVGDDLFFDALRTYHNTYAEGSAVTEELRQVFEEVCDIDLEAFFNEWVYQAGHPIYNFNNFTVIPDVNGNLATIDLRRTKPLSRAPSGCLISIIIYAIICEIARAKLIERGGCHNATLSKSGIYRGAFTSASFNHRSVGQGIDWSPK